MENNINYEAESSDASFNEDEFNEQLAALREMTKLNPIDYLKVMRARKQAEKLRDLYVKYEPNDIIGVDYTVANDLEYELRKKALSRNVESDWRSYISVENDGYGLSQFTEDVIKDKVQENRRTR